MYRLVGFGSKRSTPENRFDPICFLLDLAQVKLIQFYFFGFCSSRVDPIFFELDLDFEKKMIFLIKIQLFLAIKAFGEIERVLAVSRGGARESKPQMPTLAQKLTFNTVLSKIFSHVTILI